MKVLRRKQVEDRTGIPRSTLYWKIKRDEFPKPVKLGERSVGWLESEIDKWITQRVALSDSR